MNSQQYSHQIKNQEVIDNFLSMNPKLIKNKLDFTDAYYQSVKRYFQKIKKNNYIFKDKYEITACGRMMNENRCIQNLSNELRSSLFSNQAYDIDIVNCSFNIVKYIINTYFSDKKDTFKQLINYADNREQYLKYNFDKLNWISVLFHKDPKSYIKKSIYDDDFNRLILEINIFQDLLIENKHKFKVEKFKENVDKGSHVSYIIFHIENEVLQQIINEFKSIIIAPIFDGILVDKLCDLNKVLKTCNEIGSKYGLKFINKSFQSSKLDLLCPPDYETSEKEDYMKMKLSFEKEHFMIENPLMFVKEYVSQGETQFVYYSKSDFISVVAPYQLEDKKGNDQDFFYEWIKDVDRRSYKTMEFIPSLKEDDNRDDNYNSFTGFKAKLVEVPNTLEDQFKLVNDVYDGEAVKTFTNHLNHLVSNESEGLRYLIGYIADMFQNPYKLPSVAILFKSKQGSGKDLMISILGDILGQKLLHQEAKMENITGTFNNSLKHKIIVQLNEVCGKDGNFNRELLKDLITSENLNLREMRKDIQLQHNCLRLFLATNNRTAINIPQDDRRYVVFKCGDPKTEKYYNKIVKFKTSKKALNSIYSYFMHYDLSKFNLKKRYISQEYKNLQQSTTNPFHEFLYDFCLDHDDFNIRTNNDFSYISMNDIYVGYENYLEEENLTNTIKTNKRDVKSLFVDCGVIEERIRINKKLTRAFKFKFNDLQEYLEKHYIKDLENIVEFEDEELSFID